MGEAIRERMGQPVSDNVGRAARPTRSLRTDDWLRPSALTNVLVLSLAATVAVALLVLFASGGWEDYTTPLRVRAYAPGHPTLRPSGVLGKALGIIGMLMMTVPLLYALRKKWKRLSRFGEMRRWLDVHIFCGIVGPVLVTFHSAMKFNGIISVAYWSMVAVVLSGFVGRYLFVRIPRTIRGTELSYEEILSRAATLRTTLAASDLSADILARLDDLDRQHTPKTGAAVFWAYVVEPFADNRRLRTIGRALRDSGMDAAHAHETLHLARERALLLRRLEYLETTKHLFAMWHVFHQPLVYVMFGIAVAHVALAVYFGYALFPQG